MSRKILVVSLVLLVVGLAVLVYSDPVARLSFGRAGTGFPTGNTTRTFTFAGGTPGNFTISGGTGTRGGLAGATTTDRVFTLVALALVAVGVVLEALALFLTQGGKGVPPKEGASPDGKPA